MSQPVGSSRAVLVEMVARVAEIEKDEVVDELDLLSLDLDSLDLSSMLLEVEEALDIEIPVDAIAALFDSGSLTFAALVRVLDGLGVGDSRV